MEELYKNLFEAGDYTKSFEEFVDQFGDAKKSENLYKALNQAGDYTKSFDEFKTQFGFSEKKNLVPSTSQEVVTESTTTTETQDGSSDSLEGIKDPTQAQIESIRETFSGLTNEELNSDKNIQAAINSGYISEDDLYTAGYRQPEQTSVLSAQPSYDDKQEAIRKISALKTKTSDDIDYFISQKKLDTPYAYENNSDLVEFTVNPEDELKKTQAIQAVKSFEEETKKLIEANPDITQEEIQEIQAREGRPTNEQYELSERTDIAPTGFENTNIDKMYKVDGLKKINGFNIKDFDGYINEQGYKEEYLRLLEEETISEGERNYDASGNYNPSLAAERLKLKYLSNYINKQAERDLEFKKLDYQKEKGVDPSFDNVTFEINSGISDKDLTNYIEEQFPIITSKLKERDIKNQELYQDMKSGDVRGSWRKAGAQAFKQGWRSLSDRVNSFSAGTYDFFGADNIADEIRMNQAESELGREDFMRYVYASGKEVIDSEDTNYVVDDKGQIYDTDLELRVTDVLTPSKVKEIYSEAGKSEKETSTFSTSGMIIEGTGVAADMTLQILATRGISVLGQSARAALTSNLGLTATAGVSGGVVNILSKVPMRATTASSMIAQGTLFSTNLSEQAYAQALDNGMSMNQAREIKSIAGSQGLALGVITAPLSTQSYAIDKIFGKNANNVLLKGALEAYQKAGAKGAKAFWTKAGLKATRYMQEGGKEVFQENVQQAGETYVINKNINEFAKKEIMADTISGDQFINTTILSAFSGFLMPFAGDISSKAKTSFNKRYRPGVTAIDKMTALYELSKDVDKTTQLLNSQVKKGLYTEEQVKSILEDVDVYKNTVNSLPDNLSANTALSVMRDINEIKKQEKLKNQLDPAFHKGIDEKIQDIRNDITKKTNFDFLSKKSQQELKEDATKELTKEAQERGEQDFELNDSQITFRAIENFSNLTEEAQKKLEEQSEGKTTTKKEVTTGDNQDSFNIQTKNGDNINIEVDNSDKSDIPLTDREYGNIIRAKAINDNGKEVGRFTFFEDADGNYYASNAEVNEDNRSQGIASSVYKGLMKKGINIVPAKVQTKEGKQFWENLSKSITKDKVDTKQAVAAEQVVNITPETSSNYANMTEDSDGNFVFFHSGNKGYETVKPMSGDSKATSRAEAAALSKVGGMAMYYTSDRDTERQGADSAKYVVKIPKEKVYDFNNDTNNYLEEAKKRHEEEHPGKAFDLNTQLAYVTKIAGENGFDMVVSEWAGGTRAQTTQELKPVDVKEKDGARITKQFSETYVDNKEKGFVSVVPTTMSEMLSGVYDKIYKERNKTNTYDDLYFLAEKKADYTQDEITKLVNESDISQELKDEYNAVVETVIEPRRSKKVNIKDDYTSNEIDKLKSLPTESESGATMNLDGSKYENGGLVLPVASVNMKVSDLTVEAVDNLIKENSESIGSDNVKVGIYKFPNSDNASIDINIVADRSMRSEALKIGKELGQESLFDLDTFENIKTGADGKNPKKLTPKEFLEIQERLKPKEDTKTTTEAQKIKEIMSVDVSSQVEDAKKALSSIAPDVEIILHESEQAYAEATGETGRKQKTAGSYNETLVDGKVKKVIHINPDRANERTVAHEVFHAIFLNNIKNDTEAQRLSAAMIKAVYKTAPAELKRIIDDFATSKNADGSNNYNLDVQNEEKLAELIGYLASEYDSLPKPTKGVIKRFLDRLAKMFGMKPFTDNEVIDVLNTIAKKVSTGEAITVDDIVVFNKQGSQGSVGVFKIARNQRQSPNPKNDSRPWVRELVDVVKIKDLEGEKFITNMYDFTTAGEVDLAEGLKMELLGGRNYVPYMMNKTGKKMGDVSNLAAFNSKSAAEGFVNSSKQSGAKLFAPHIGTMEGSWQFQHHIFKSLVDIVLDNKLIPKSTLIKEWNDVIKSKAGKELIDQFNSRNATNLRTFNKFSSNPKELVDLLDIENNFSPKLRKALNDKLVSIKSLKEKLDIKNKMQILSKMIDPLNKGAESFDIMSIVEFDPDTFEVVKTKLTDPDHHPSFGWTVKSKINKVLQPDYFYKSYDITDSYTKYNLDGTTVSKKTDFKDIKDFSSSNVSSSAGAIPKVAEFKPITKSSKQQVRIEDIIDKLKSNGISDASVIKYLEEQGFKNGAKEVAKYNKANDIKKNLNIDVDPDEVRDRYNADNAPTVEDIRNRSEKNIADRTKKKSIKEASRLVREKLLDRQTRIKDLLKGISSKKALNAMAKLVTKAGANGYANFRFEKADKKIFKGLSVSDRNTLDEIIYATRIIAINENRRKKGEKTYKGIGGYNDISAKRDLDNIRQKIGDKKFEDLVAKSKEYFKVFDESLKRMREARIISEEVYNQLKDLEYSPIKTIKYTLPENVSSEELDRVAAMTGVNSDAIKSLTDENQNDIIMDSRWLLMTNLSMIEAKIFENKMLNAFSEAIESATTEEKQAINEIVLDNPIIGNYKNGKPKRKYDEKYDSINYTKVFYNKDGNQEYMVISKPYARQLLDVKSKPGVTEKIIPKLTGTSVLRFFATSGNPLFIVGNTAVDFQNILFLSDVYSKNKFVGGAKLAADFIKEFSSKLMKTDRYNKVYEEYMIHGGSIDYLSVDGLKALEGFSSKSKLKNISVDAMKKVGNFMSYLGETSEISFRLAVYEKSKENQIKKFKKENSREPNKEEMSDIMFEATREARETIDFSQGGSVTKAADKTLPYLNAATQGLRKGIDYANKNPKGFASSMIQASLMAGSMMATSLYLLMRNMDDEEEVLDVLESISDYEKSNYFIIFTGEKDEDGEYEYYRIKKLPLVSVFSTLAEQLVIKSVLKSRNIDYDVNGEVMNKALKSAAPIIPTPKEFLQRNPLLSSVITYTTNYDMFYDKPIFEKQRGKDIDPEAEGIYDDRVNQIYKDLAPALGMSPIRTKAAMEKIITSETTNPAIGLLYSGYDIAFRDDTTVGKEITGAKDQLFSNVSKKLKRKTNKNLISYKEKAKAQEEKMKIETDIYKKEQEVYNEIRKNKDITKKEISDIVKNKFDKVDRKKYYKKYVTYSRKRDIDKSILNILYEDTPEVQALYLFNKFGDSFDSEEKDMMKTVMKAARRKISKKAMYIYNQKYKKK